MGGAVDIAGLPGLPLAELMGVLLQGLFAMLRVGAFVIAAPLFAAQFIPLPVRIIFAVVLAIPVFTLHEMPPVSALVSLSILPMVLTELLIGLAAGLVLQILFAAAMMAGDWIAATAGLGFAAQMDPTTGTQTPVISQLLFLLLLALFLAEDGHLAAIRMVIESYHFIAPGEGIDLDLVTDVAMAATRQMYSAAASLMMPVVSVLLIANVVIGIITRSAPQMNLFSFGFPLTLSVAILLLFLTAPSLGNSLANLVPEALELVALLTRGGIDG